MRRESSFVQQFLSAGPVELGKCHYSEPLVEMESPFFFFLNPVQRVLHAMSNVSMCHFASPSSLAPGDADWWQHLSVLRCCVSGGESSLRLLCFDRGAASWCWAYIGVWWSARFIRDTREANDKGLVKPSILFCLPFGFVRVLLSCVRVCDGDNGAIGCPTNRPLSLGYMYHLYSQLGKSSFFLSAHV